MDRYSLDLTLELTQGAIHNLGDLLLLCRLWASTFLPTGELPKAMFITRTDDWHLVVQDVTLDSDVCDRIVAYVRALGFPMRTPRIVAERGNLTGWQRLRLVVALDGAEQMYTLDLQHAGAAGADAALMRMLIEELLTTVDPSIPWSRFQVV